MPGISATRIPIPFSGGGGTDWSAYCTPQLILTPTLYTEEMDVTTGWVASNCTLAQNTDEVYSGTGSMKMTTNSGASGRATKPVSWDLSECQGGSIRVWAYIHTDPSVTVNALKFTAYTGAGAYTDYFSATYTDNLPQNEWFLVRPNGITGWAVGGGTPNWNDVRYFRLLGEAKSGQQPIISWDFLSAGQTMKKAIIIMSDDSHPSVYDKMFAYMKTKDMVGTHNMISERFDQVGQLTTAQLQEMYADGWDVGNHSSDGLTFVGLTEGEVEAKLETCRVALESKGLTRASRHVAYPRGNYDATVLAAMTSFGALTGRTLGYTGFDFSDTQLYPFKLPTSSVTNTHAVATVKGWIDKQISINTIPVLLFHMIKDVTDGLSTTYVTADFQEIIDYIETLGLQTLTISEYNRLWTEGITVTHH